MKVSRELDRLGLSPAAVAGAREETALAPAGGGREGGAQLHRPQ